MSLSAAWTYFKNAMTSCRERESEREREWENLVKKEGGLKNGRKRKIERREK